MKVKSPVSFAVKALLVFIVIIGLPIHQFFEGLGFSDFHAKNGSQLFQNMLVITLAILFIKKFKLFSLAGLSDAYKGQQHYWVLLPLYLILIGCFQLVGQDFSTLTFSDVALLFVATLSIGFSEEFVFRGLIQAVFLTKYGHRKKGILISVLFPAFLFGAMHLLNLSVSSNKLAVISQVFYAGFIGVFFGATLLKTNRLIPLAIMHGLIDFVFQFNSLPGMEETQESSSDFIDAVASLLVVAPLFVVGLFIIKRLDKTRIIEKIEAAGTSDHST